MGSKLQVTHINQVVETFTKLVFRELGPVGALQESIRVWKILPPPLFPRPYG